MIMLDTVDFPVVFLGAIRAGIVPVPLNTLLTADQYAYMLADCRARVLFVSEALLSGRERRRGADGRSRLRRRLRQERIRAQAAVRRAQTRATRFTTVDDPSRRTRVLALFVGLNRHAQGRAAPACEPAATAETYARQVLGIREDDVVPSAAKLFFAYGLGNALTFPLSVGATTVLNPDRPTPAAMFALLNKIGPDDLLRRADAVCGDAQRRALQARRRGRGLRICTSAGEALPESVGYPGRRASASIFSMASAQPSCCTSSCRTRPATSSYGTSGRAGSRLRVAAGRRAGGDVPDGEVGELSSGAFGRRRLLESAQKEPRDTFEGDWTRTGDKYIRDADGRYTFCGRGDDMFKVSGIWVSPFEVESALITHPAVLEAAVVPDAERKACSSRRPSWCCAAAQSRRSSTRR